MNRPNHWNHNTAYYPWIRKHLSGCRSVLDVGCGDGALARCLNDGEKEIVGIDADPAILRKASLLNSGYSSQFVCCPFEDYDPGRKFDAVVFVASLHHMDMTPALERAKALLALGGKILIVGLAKPSGFLDYSLESVRIIPSKLSSLLHRMQSSEELSIRTSYDYPQMREVRRTVSTILPHARIRYGLHYRYLLEWRSSGKEAQAWTSPN